jgi:hypothetical protein
MIAFVRTASVAPGKTGAAIGFAHEIAGYMKSSYDVELEVLRPTDTTGRFWARPATASSPAR